MTMTSTKSGYNPSDPNRRWVEREGGGGEGIPSMEKPKTRFDRHGFFSFFPLSES